MLPYSLEVSADLVYFKVVACQNDILLTLFEPGYDHYLFEPGKQHCPTPLKTLEIHIFL